MTGDFFTLMIMFRIISGLFIFVSLVYPLSLFFFDMMYYSFKGDFYFNKISDRAFSRIVFSVKISLVVEVISIFVFIYLSI